GVGSPSVAEGAKATAASAPGCEVGLVEVRHLFGVLAQHVREHAFVADDILSYHAHRVHAIVHDAGDSAASSGFSSLLATEPGPLGRTFTRHHARFAADVARAPLTTSARRIVASSVYLLLSGHALLAVETVASDVLAFQRLPIGDQLAVALPQPGESGRVRSSHVVLHGERVAPAGVRLAVVAHESEQQRGTDPPDVRSTRAAAAVTVADDQL